MDESVARADRLRAMREAASGSMAHDAAPTPGAAQTSLPAPFSDTDAANTHQRPGFYTGAGSAPQCSPSANAARAPPPPPQPPAHWVNDAAEPPRFQHGRGGRGQGRGGGQFRGNKAARTTSGYVKTINPAEYYKVCRRSLM